jgi:predicted nucleotidyltransferase
MPDETTTVERWQGALERLVAEGFEFTVQERKELAELMMAKPMLKAVAQITMATQQQVLGSLALVDAANAAAVAGLQAQLRAPNAVFGAMMELVAEEKNSG